METRYFRFRWDESRGDSFDSWGGATYFFATDGLGWPERQVEVYDAGPTLCYGPDHIEDEYGQLGQASVFDTSEDWTSLEIPKEAFEEAWRPVDLPKA